MYKVYFFLFALFLFNTTRAQEGAAGKVYPKDYFRWPLDLSPSLTGVFGDIRPNHFHSGLDFRTNQREGYPVYAVADGYVSRVRVQIGGGGNYLYITHPNGYTSVYMHLQRYGPAITQTLKNVQSRTESFAADFKLLPIEIPIKKGEIIGWSGNTGSSGGPHLHFEMRDTNTEETINPQLVGLVLPDYVQPAITGVYVYRLNKEPFSEKTPKQYFPVVGSAGRYDLKQAPIVNINGETGLGIICSDKNLASANARGIYSIQLWLDGKQIYSSVLERFDFEHSRGINSYVDYPALLTTNKRIQKSFVEPGNPLKIYKNLINNGLINLTDTLVHEAEYIVRDVVGNMSSLCFNLKYDSTLVVAAKEKTGTIKFRYNEVNSFSNDAVKIQIPKGILYDDIDFTYSSSPKTVGKYSAVHKIHTLLMPVHSSYSLSIKTEDLPAELQEKALIVDGNRTSQGGSFENGYIKAEVKTFGSFYVAVDTIAPKITPVNIKEDKDMEKISKMVFKISDNLSGIKSFTGKIDGQWVLMEFDPKTATLWHTFDEQIALGRHAFELTVTDMKLNTRTININFFKSKLMTELKEGDKAPAFTANDQHGNPVSLSNYAGKTVILYFYPKDDTPGCTAEACSFRDNYQSLLKEGFEVIGVSTDDEKSHQKFVTKYQLPFTLIADTDKKIVDAYGVWVEKNMYGKKYMGTARKTFVIGADGVIKKVFDKVDTKNSSQQVLDALK